MKTLKDKKVSEYDFKTEKYKIYYKETDAKKHIKNSREKLRALIWELAKDYGGSVLHYNEKIDDIYSQEFGL